MKENKWNNGCKEYNLGRHRLLLNDWMNEWMNNERKMNEWMNQSINQSINE